MTWNEHILYAKAKAEKKMNIIKGLSHTKWGADQQNLIKIYCMVVLSTVRYGEEAYDSASQTILRKLEPTNNKGLKLAFGLFVICRTENVLGEANLPTLAEMRELNNVKMTIRMITNPTPPPPIRPFCVDLKITDEYVHRPATPTPSYARAS
jgi:hypothetical protein